MKLIKITKNTFNTKKFSVDVEGYNTQRFSTIHQAKSFAELCNENNEFVIEVNVPENVRRIPGASGWAR